MATTPAVQPSDAQLVAASRFDGVHFVSVFDRHVTALHRYLARRLGDPGGDANLGDAVSAAYAARRHFRAWGDSAGPWLLGTATGIVRRQWRLEQARLRSCAERSGADGAGALVEHLQHLAARDRDLLVLAAWEGQQPGAIAMALDLPEGAVTNRLTALATQVAHLGAPPRPAVDPAGEGLARLRSLRPEAAGVDAALAARVRGDLQVLTGHAAGRGAARSTVSVAAEHEQHRRWLARPGASLVRRRQG